MELYVQQFVLFFLIFVRISAFFISAPILGHQAAPIPVKLGISGFISVVMFPMISAQTPNIDARLLVFVLMILREAMAGLLLGFTVTLLFSAVRFAGEIIAYNMNLTVANVFDPESNQSNPVIGEFLFLTTLLIFLALNGHHFLLESIVMTYSTVPVGTFAISKPMFDVVQQLTAVFFASAVKIAAPVLAAMFLTNIALAVVSRVMPQMNVFIVAFPLNIGIGLLILLSSSSMFVFVTKKMLLNFENSILELVKAM